MRLKKKILTKLSMIGVLTFVVLGLTACGGAESNSESPAENNEPNQTNQATGESSNQGSGTPSSGNGQLDLSFFDDFPDWWFEQMEQESMESLLNLFSAEELEEMRQAILEGEADIHIQTQGEEAIIRE